MFDHIAIHNPYVFRLHSHILKTNKCTMLYGTFSFNNEKSGFYYVDKISPTRYLVLSQNRKFFLDWKQNV